MANFDDILKSKIDAFDANVQPSATELNRLNSSLDLMTRRGMGWKSVLLYTLLFLLLFSQCYLVYTNWLLNKKVDKNDATIGLLSEKIAKLKADTSNENKGQKTGLSDQQNGFSIGNQQNTKFPNALDNQKIAEDYLDNKEAIINRLLAQLEKANHQQLNKTDNEYSHTKPNTNYSASSSNNSSQQSNKNVLNINSKLRGNENDQWALGKNTVSPNEVINESNGETNLNQKPNLSPKSDTVVIKELVVDSSLYDSLVSALAKQNKEGFEAPRQAKEIAWTAGFGLRPSYSNLYLLDGRMVYDFHVVTGFNYNNRWALNAGFKYRNMNVHDYVTDSNTNPVEDFDQFKTKNFKAPFELEGKAHGFYIPVDFQYFFKLGNFNPFARAGLDLNIYTTENYKIEEDLKPEFNLNQTSRRMQISSYSLGLGGRSQLGKNFSFEYEGGYLLGRSLNPILLSDRNGIYVQARIVYVIKRG